MKYDVVVMGSINLDTMVYIDQFPNGGDNVVAKGSINLAGGKGSSQAVAVAKQGVTHAFIGAVGTDETGRQMKQLLREKGVDTSHMIERSDSQTGISTILIDKDGENTCFGVLGANMSMTSMDIKAAMEDVEGTIFLLQLETSKDSVLAALELAKKKGMYIILDPAPEGLYFEEALAYADLVTPNKMETQAITGIAVDSIEAAQKAAHAIADMGVQDVIVKMGAKGSVLYQTSTDVFTFIEAEKVVAVNTVGAGDTFAGVLAALLSQGTDLIRAVQAATKAAALKVSRSGGQDAIPTYNEIKQYL